MIKVTIEARDWEDAVYQVKYFAGIREEKLSPLAEARRAAEFPSFNVAKNARIDPAPGDTAKGDPAMRGLAEKLEDLKPGPKGEAAVPTYEDAYNAVKALMKAKGDEAAIRLVNDFGAVNNSVKTVAPERRAALIAKAKELMS